MTLPLLVSMTKIYGKTQFKKEFILAYSLRICGPPQRLGIAADDPGDWSNAGTLTGIRELT